MQRYKFLHTFKLRADNFPKKIRNIAPKVAKFLRLGKKKERISFVLLSTLRNFAQTNFKEYNEGNKSKRKQQRTEQVHE